MLGIAPPKLFEYKDSQYPPDSKWDRSAYLRLTMTNQGGMGVEIIESVGGPTPWSGFVERQKARPCSTSRSMSAPGWTT